MSIDEILTERLSRSADVEDILYNIAAGKLEIPDAEGFRTLAIRLGVPKAQWSPEVKKYKFKEK